MGTLLHTLGISSLRAISAQASAAVQAILVNKTAAYLGTVAWTTDAPDYPHAYAGEHTCFFALPAVNETGTAVEQHTILPIVQPVPATYTCKLYVPDTDPGKLGLWKDSGITLPPEWVIQVLVPATRLANVLYKVQRGHTADIANAIQEDGAQFFDKDQNIMFVYNEQYGQYVSVTGSNIGVITIWPEHPSAPPLPFGWLKCDGRKLLISEYSILFNFIQHYFDWGVVNTATEFCLPNQSNTIIRYI
jgi:hypothetical protein